jgi:hypothetical protein
VAEGTKTNHTRGWRRIGVILSVIWFVGFGLYAWTDSTTQSSNFYKASLSVCYGLSKPADGDRCKNEATALFKQEADKRWEQFPLFLAFDLATVAVGWLLVWAVVALVRWVGRGFSSA